MLIGNAFPMGLIRRPVTITPVSLAEAQEACAGNAPVSFWGHMNTAKIASALLGFDVTPKTERPALTLNGDNFPQLDKIPHPFVLIVSPEYAQGYRPAVGEETPPDKILGWQFLVMEF